MAARRGTRRGAAGASRRGGARRPRSGGVPPIVGIAVLLVLAGGGVWFVMTSTADKGDGLSRGDDLMASAKFDQAIAAYQSVPADSPLHAEAQARIEEARGRKQTAAAVEARTAANAPYQLLQSIKKSYVDRDGKGQYESDYRPNTRYLLKRAKEFTERFPNDERAAEVAGWHDYYEDVASLAEPPTIYDVRAELKFRTKLVSTTHRDYAACVRAINEFAAANPGSEAQVAELRGQLQADVDETWDQVLRQQVQPRLDSQNPDWQKIGNDVKTFLDAVQAGSGLRPPQRALDLLAKAESMPAGG